MDDLLGQLHQKKVDKLMARGLRVIKKGKYFEAVFVDKSTVGPFDQTWWGSEDASYSQMRELLTLLYCAELGPSIEMFIETMASELTSKKALETREGDWLINFTFQTTAS